MGHFLAESPNNVAFDLSDRLQGLGVPRLTAWMLINFNEQSDGEEDGGVAHCDGKRKSHASPHLVHVPVFFSFCHAPWGHEAMVPTMSLVGRERVFTHEAQYLRRESSESFVPKFSSKDVATTRRKELFRIPALM